MPVPAAHLRGRADQLAITPVPPSRLRASPGLVSPRADGPRCPVRRRLLARRGWPLPQHPLCPRDKPRPAVWPSRATAAPVLRVTDYPFVAVIGRSIETERARGVLEASRGLVSGRGGAGLITYIDSSGTELIGLRGDLCWLRRHSGRRRLEPPTAVRMRHSGRAPQLPEGRCVSRTERFERARASYVPDEPPPATRGSRCDPSGTVFASLRGPPVDMMQDELRKPTTREE